MVGLLGSEKTATPFEGGTEIDQVTGSVVLLSSSSMADIDGAIHEFGDKSSETIIGDVGKPTKQEGHPDWTKRT